jgi:hypothetical protein
MSRCHWGAALNQSLLLLLLQGCHQSGVNACINKKRKRSIKRIEIHSKHSVNFHSNMLQTLRSTESKKGQQQRASLPMQRRKEGWECQNDSIMFSWLQFRLIQKDHAGDCCGTTEATVLKQQQTQRPWHQPTALSSPQILLHAHVPDVTNATVRGAYTAKNRISGYRAVGWTVGGRHFLHNAQTNRFGFEQAPRRILRQPRRWKKWCRAAMDPLVQQNNHMSVHGPLWSPSRSPEGLVSLIAPSPTPIAWNHNPSGSRSGLLPTPPRLAYRHLCHPRMIQLSSSSAYSRSAVVPRDAIADTRPSDLMVRRVRFLR